MPNQSFALAQPLLQEMVPRGDACCSGNVLMLICLSMGSVSAVILSFVRIAPYIDEVRQHLAIQQSAFAVQESLHAGGRGRTGRSGGRSAITLQEGGTGRTGGRSGGRSAITTQESLHEGDGGRTGGRTGGRSDSTIQASLHAGDGGRTGGRSGGRSAINVEESLHVGGGGSSGGRSGGRSAIPVEGSMASLGSSWRPSPCLYKSAINIQESLHAGSGERTGDRSGGSSVITVEKSLHAEGRGRTEGRSGGRSGASTGKTGARSGGRGRGPDFRYAPAPPPAPVPTYANWYEHEVTHKMELCKATEDLLNAGLNLTFNLDHLLSTQKKLQEADMENFNLQPIPEARAIVPQQIDGNPKWQVARQGLPIFQYRAMILQAVTRSQVTIIEGETG